VTPLEAILRQVGSDLTDAGVRFALVGGLAVSARTEPRFTRDADLAVAVANDAEAEVLVHHLRARGYGIEAVVEQEAAGRMATVRLSHGSGTTAPVVDLLFASSGIEPEIVAAAEPMALLKGLMMPVARTGHLIAVKVLARDDVNRPQDLVDLRALVKVASPQELTLAQRAIELITARGYHRGRDLRAGLDALLEP
jgi:predicted nucleotidyltransferase